MHRRITTIDGLEEEDRLHYDAVDRPILPRPAFIEPLAR
jgi:hypothetical protein